MKLFYSKVIATALGLISTSGAYALIDTEASVGQRTEKFIYDTVNGKSKSATGSEITASLMFDPIPAIPVSFGLTVQSSTIDRSKVDEAYFSDSLGEGAQYFDITSKGSSTSVLYGPVVKIWAPTPFVKPYLKFAYLMGSGSEKIDADINSNATSPVNVAVNAKGSQKFSHTGTDLDLGLGFSPTKLFTLFFEYAIHSGSSKITDYTLESVSVSDSETTSTTTTKDDLTDDDKKSQKANATAVRVGISIGF